MGSIGPAEILVVLVVALIVLGPNKLPDAAKSMGKALAELRRMSSGVQAEVREAFAEPPTYPKPPPSPTDVSGGELASGSTPPGGLPDSPEQAEVAVVRERETPPTA